MQKVVVVEVAEAEVVEAGVGKEVEVEGEAAGADQAQDPVVQKLVVGMEMIIRV